MKCMRCNQVDLTTEESNQPKPICYYCVIDIYDSLPDIIRAATGPAPSPEDYGRTPEQVNAFLLHKKKINEDLDKRKEYLKTANLRDLHDGLPPETTSHEIDMGVKNGKIPRPGKLPYLGEDSDLIAKLNKMFEKDQEPYDFNISINDDFMLKFRVPGPLPPEYQEVIKRQAQKLFSDTLFLKLQGSIFAEYFKDPYQPDDRNPFKQFM
jgi:hypothetical protein